MGERLLGRQIDRARKYQGLTVEKLSESCSEARNVNVTYLRQIE